MRIAFIVIGLLMIFGTFFISEVYIGPQQASQIRLANEVCQAELLGVPLGQIAQGLSSDVARNCQEARYISMFLDFTWFFYCLGAVLLMLGVSTGGKKERVVYIKDGKRIEKPDDIEEYEDEKHLPLKVILTFLVICVLSVLLWIYLITK